MKTGAGWGWRVGRGQTRSDPVGHVKGLIFYIKCDGEPPKNFEPKPGLS